MKLHSTNSPFPITNNFIRIIQQASTLHALKLLIHIRNSSISPPHFHEICSSSFLTDSWISSLFLANATSHNILDFRSFTFAQFQALALLCQTAQSAIKDGVRTFNATRLITTQLRSRSEFNDIAHVLTMNLRNHLIASDSQMARIVSTNIGYNRLISALGTNFRIRYDPLLEDFLVQNGLYLRDRKKFFVDMRLSIRRKSVYISCRCIL